MHRKNHTGTHNNPLVLHCLSEIHSPIHGIEENKDVQGEQLLD